MPSCSTKWNTRHKSSSLANEIPERYAENVILHYRADRKQMGEKSESDQSHSH